jgi:hypothetical protein
MSAAERHQPSAAPTSAVQPRGQLRRRSTRKSGAPGMAPYPYVPQSLERRAILRNANENESSSGSTTSSGRSADNRAVQPVWHREHWCRHLHRVVGHRPFREGSSFFARNLSSSSLVRFRAASSAGHSLSPRQFSDASAGVGLSRWRLEDPRHVPTAIEQRTETLLVLNRERPMVAVSVEG